MTGKRELWKQTGAGQKLISWPRLKAHLSRQRSVIEDDSGGSPHANGGADVDAEDDEEDRLQLPAD